eukprot:10290757-Alexandrium_andersonii.AAC.1
MAESRAALPLQQLAVLMATLPKPNSGERQLCLLGVFARLRGRCRADIAESGVSLHASTGARPLQARPLSELRSGGLQGARRSGSLAS